MERRSSVGRERRAVIMLLYLGQDYWISLLRINMLSPGSSISFNVDAYHLATLS
jgi:hypothetical protein